MKCKLNLMQYQRQDIVPPVHKLRLYNGLMHLVPIKWQTSKYLIKWVPLAAPTRTSPQPETSQVPCREHFFNAPSQWEMTLHCNVVSHWQGAYTKLSLTMAGFTWNVMTFITDILRSHLVKQRHIYTQPMTGIFIQNTRAVQLWFVQNSSNIKHGKYCF